METERLRVICLEHRPQVLCRPTRFLFPLLIIAFALMLPTAARAKRLAFVVGIDGYVNLDAGAQLKRAINDARGVAQALRKLRFEVIPLYNAGRSSFNARWQQFLGAIEPGDEVVFFFSGHGVEIEGQNFLVPGDIPKISYGRQEQIKRESLSVSELLLDLRRREPKVSLVILDACRDHPLAQPEWRSGEKPGGLAKIDASRGTFIMYSAGAGERALDRLPGNDPDPTNSVYTRNLLPLLQKPGLKLTEMAIRVRREVHDLAATVPHEQTPAYYDGLLVEYCLAGCADQRSAPDALTRGGAPAATPIAGVAALTTAGAGRIDRPMKLEIKASSISNMENSFISLKGLPTTAILSTGFEAGDRRWLLPLHSSKGLFVSLPDGVTDDFKLEIRFLSDYAEFPEPVIIILQVGLAL